MVCLNLVIHKIVYYLAELFSQIVCYLEELFLQIAFPFCLCTQGSLLKVFSKVFVSIQFQLRNLASYVVYD